MILNSWVDHNLIREEAFSLAMINILQRYGENAGIDTEKISFGSITSNDSEKVSAEWQALHKKADVDFDWWGAKRKEKRGIDVTIKYDDFLCGLMIVKLSKKRLRLTLRYLEGHPENHPLKGLILPIALIVAESLATSYSIKKVLISRPAKGLIENYIDEGYGYTSIDKDRLRRNAPPRVKLLTKTI